MKQQEKKDIDTVLKETLEAAPSIERYNITQYSDVVNNWWKLPRWHIESLKVPWIERV